MLNCLFIKKELETFVAWQVPMWIVFPVTENHQSIFFCVWLGSSHHLCGFFLHRQPSRPPICLRKTMIDLVHPTAVPSLTGHDRSTADCCGWGSLTPPQIRSFVSFTPSHLVKWAGILTVGMKYERGKINESCVLGKWWKTSYFIKTWNEGAKEEQAFNSWGDMI